MAVDVVFLTLAMRYGSVDYGNRLEGQCEAEERDVVVLVIMERMHHVRSDSV